MTKRIPDYLKLHVEESSENSPLSADGQETLAGLCRAFESVTGWKLRVGSDSTDQPSTVVAASDSQATTSASGSADVAPNNCNSSSSHGRAVPRSDAEQLAAEIMVLLGELHDAQQAVWERDADLAAGVPVRRRNDEDAHLALRLEAILKGGAEAVGCQSTGLYLLDDATSELKLRACWGMPRRKLLEPARPLRGAIADLEALLGHAVVIDDTTLLPHWKVPECCASAVCVPVASPTEPLGTLWAFCDYPRDFTPQQTNLLEIIAGRISVELERDVLLAECERVRRLITDD